MSSLQVPTKSATLLLVTAFLILGTGIARAQDEPAERRTWTNSADLSVVLTGGNSEATNISLSNRFTVRWHRSEVRLTASALRSRTVERGDPELLPDGQVRVPESEATAEAFSAEGRYRYRLGPAVLAYSGGGWERDRRAGIDDRFNGVLGLGYEILTGDRQNLLLELGADYTDESRVDGTGQSYAGLRSTIGYERTLTETSTVTTELQVLESLEDTEDLRLNSTTSLTASLTQNLALKVTYALKYDNQPVLILVEPGVSDAVFVFDRTDTRFGVSLVVNF